MLVTDMSRRERRSLAVKAEELAKSAEMLAGALRATAEGDVTDDTEILTHCVLTALSGRFISELSEVFHNAVSAKIPDSLQGLTSPPPKKPAPPPPTAHPLADYRANYRKDTN
jgi:hypothetical protein